MGLSQKPNPICERKQCCYASHRTTLCFLCLSLNHIQLRVQLTTTDSTNDSINCWNEVHFVPHNDCCFATFKFNKARAITNSQQY